MRFKQIKASQMLNTAMDGFSVLVEHESSALGNLRAGLRERLLVAKQARSVGELLRNQVDLLAETQAHLRRDHGLRSALLKGFSRDLCHSVGLHRAS